jgi:hypothetical protein
MINWFDMDTIEYPTPGKTLNNYLLTEDPAVLQAWNNETDAPQYLQGREHLGDAQPPLARPMAGLSLSGVATLRFWAKSYQARPRLFVELDGVLISETDKTGATPFRLDTGGLSVGPHRIVAYLYDSSDRFVSSASATFKVAR